MKPLRPSADARRMIAQNPTPLRARYATNGGLVPQVERAPLRARLEDWVLTDASGTVRRARSGLSDLLVESPAAITRLLAPLPVHVFDARPDSLRAAAEAMLAHLAPDSPLPRVLVLPADVYAGQYADEAEWLGARGFVVVRRGTGEVERLAARLSARSAKD